MGLRKQWYGRGLAIPSTTKVIQFFYHRCSTDIKGSKAVHERQRGSDVTRLCRWDSRTGLYEPKCKFFPDKIQTARASIMFMQNLNSVSTSRFFLTATKST